MRPGTLRRLIPCALLLLPGVADAPASVHGAIHVYSALTGKFAFIEPDGGLTVLDSATGKVLFHGEPHGDERYTWNSFFDTPHGLVMRSYRWKLLTRDESVYRRLDFERQAIAWEVASTRECHFGEDYLICPRAGSGLSFDFVCCNLRRVPGTAAECVEKIVGGLPQ